MIWAGMLAYITGTVDQELLLRNEYLAAENRILRAQIKAGCSEPVGDLSQRKALEELAAVHLADSCVTEAGHVRITATVG